MPRARAQRRRRQMKKRNRRPRSRIPRNIAVPPGQQICRVTETIAAQDMVVNTLYENHFSLVSFKRAHYLSAGFGFYRAKKVTWTYEPLFNTFQEQGSFAPSIPYMYSLMNRQNDANLPRTLAGLQASGCIPRKFAAGKIKVVYRPNWTRAGLPALSLVNGVYEPTGNVVGSEADYGWIPKSSNTQTMYPAGSGSNYTGLLVTVNPVQSSVPGGSLITGNSECDSVPYLGHTVYFDQANVPAGNSIARVTCTVEWEFKTPSWNPFLIQTNLTLDPPPPTASAQQGESSA